MIRGRASESVDRPEAATLESPDSLDELNPTYAITFRADIQGLRAVAIALVVLAHAAVPGFSGGFVGVDVFFVLSGYLITGLLVKEHVASGRIRYLEFIARRLKRLLPALLTMLIVVLAIVSLLLSEYEAREQTGSLMFAVTWTSNLFFAFRELDYFSALQAQDLFLHSWSLGVEEQFYLVWPLLMSVLMWLTLRVRRAGATYSPLLLILIGLFVGSLALSLYWSQTQPLLAFYMMPSRVWQFALGAFVFIGFCDFGRDGSSVLTSKMIRSAGVVLGLAGIGLIVGSAVLLHSEITYPGVYALIPSIGAALVIAAGTGGNSAGVSGVLANKWFVWLGDRSYSLYLWHWPALLLGRAYGLSDGWVASCPLIGISVVLAWLSYRYIERPFWKGRRSTVTPGHTILASAAAMAVLLGVSQSMMTSTVDQSATAETGPAYDPRFDRPPIYADGFGCDTWYWSSEIEPCGSGDTDAPFTAVLFGDSVGAQWVSMLPEIYSAPDWQILILTKSACPMVDKEYFYVHIGEMYTVCTAWRNGALQYLAELQPDIVIVGSSSTYGFTESEWVEGSARVLEKIAGAARRVVVVPGTPALSFDGPSCLKDPAKFARRSNGDLRACEEPLANPLFREVAGYLSEAAGRYDNTALLDVGDLVCPEGLCSARRADGITVFRDTLHLTETFAMSQLPVFRDRLIALGLGPETLMEAAENAD